MGTRCWVTPVLCLYWTLLAIPGHAMVNLHPPAETGGPVLNLIQNSVSQLLWPLPWVAVSLFLLAALIVGARLQSRLAAARRNSLVSWFSSLRTFSQRIDECSDPRKMAEGALAGTLRTLGAKHGFVLLEGAVAAGLGHVSARGLSPRAVEELSAEAMRAYLALSAQRWGHFWQSPICGRGS